MPYRLTRSVGIGLAAALTVAGVVSSAPAAEASTFSPSAAYTAHRIAYDQLNRTVHQGFGYATRGGSYTQVIDGHSHTLSSRFAATSVHARSGELYRVLANHSVEEVLNSVRVHDTSATLTFAAPNTAKHFGDTIGLEVRRQSDHRYYAARVSIGANSRASLSVVNVRPGHTATVIRSLSIGRVHTGRRVTVQLVVTGSFVVTISARAWHSGASTPRWSVRHDSGVAITRSGHVGVSASTAKFSRSANTRITGLTVSSLTARPQNLHRTPPNHVPPKSTPPTTTSPPSTTNVADAGSAPVGTTKYPVPVSALFVATTGSDSTGSGLINAPLATLKAALAKVGTGGTVVVRGGDYNQDTFVGASVSGVTVESYPGEAVWFDGSIPVTTWTRSGSGWVHSGWNYHFDSSASFTSGSNAGGFVSSAYPMAAHPDEVFMDGAQLKQVAGDPGPGQFAVDYSAKTITVGSDPAGHSMRASNLSQAFVMAAGHLTLRGFGIENYATSLPLMGTVYQGGSIGHSTFENLVIRNSASTGLSLTQPGNVVEHVSAIRNGMSGMQVGTMQRGRDGAGEVVRDCDISDNDIEGFVNGPATSGIKIGGISGISIIDNKVTDNFQSTGINTDQSVTHFVITGNLVTGNGASYGILNELSSYGVVANNYISGSKYGYTVFDSGNVRVFNNVVTGNSVWQIGLSQDARYQQNVTNGPSADCPWLVRNITVSDNVMGTGGGFQFYAMDKETNRPASSMNITLTGNEFDVASNASTTMVGWGTNHHTVTYFGSPGALNTALGTTWRNLQGLPASNWNSSGAAVPLPSDIASVVGVSPATAKIGLL